ncbi:hypothetical protein [Alicyclobacillus fructus]|uniref:hypothetical protein n=1 Tax=Alicyclobacillus fructus TaxID=2816082 RepID=UPI001A8DEFD3|nr:hypothetical protein [Alicyclobacillus fructus]
MRRTWLLAASWAILWIGITLFAACILARVWLQLALPYATYVVIDSSLVAFGLALLWYAARSEKK